MHCPLFIDELLREIFFHCYESDRRTLTSAARSCKAWRDPALDTLWKRLPSLGPLLLLLPGISLEDGEYVHTENAFPLDLSVFAKYACRVKHINNRHSLKIHPSAAAILPRVLLFGTSIPNLATAHISIPRSHPTTIPLHISPSLICLDLDLGFKKQPLEDDTIIHHFLDQVVRECRDLCHVGFRGIATQHVNQTISSMRKLQSLSLRLGRSLSQETVLAIMDFPHLLDLEIHAGHITLQDQVEHYQLHPHRTFAALEKLHIRAKSYTIENILNLVQPNTLRHLHIELEDTSPSSTLWTTIFERISSKGANSLLHLTMEHHFEILESLSSLAPTATLGQDGATTANQSVTGEAFRALCSLKHLRHFACDLTIPPIIFDEDFEKLIESWPHLEHLELGPIPDNLEEEFHSHITLDTLAFVASNAPKLERLTYPLIISEELPAIFPLKQIHSSNRLHNITVARLSTSRPAQVGALLHRLFPSLVIIQGPSDDVQPWVDVNTDLQNLRNQFSRTLEEP